MCEALGQEPGRENMKTLVDVDIITTIILRMKLNIIKLHIYHNTHPHPWNTGSTSVGEALSYTVAHFLFSQ